MSEDKQMIISLESLNKIASYLATKPWNEVNQLLVLFNGIKEAPAETTLTEEVAQ